MSPSLTGDPMAGPVEEEKGRRGGIHVHVASGKTE